MDISRSFSKGSSWPQGVGSIKSFVMTETLVLESVTKEVKVSNIILKIA